MVLVPYVLVPPLSQKRKSRSPSPTDSESSAPSTPNLSPRKRPRNDKLVRDAASGIAQVSFGSPAASEIFPTSSASNNYDEDDKDVFAEPDEPVYFYNYGRTLVDELALSTRFKETGSVDEGAPIRRLSNFAIFKTVDRELVNPLALNQDDIVGVYCAAGRAREVTEDGDDDPDMSCFIEVDIIRFNSHFYSDGDLDGQIYIETQHAWYILDAPAPEYQLFWRPFCLKHRIAHSVLTGALDDASIRYNTWLDAATEEAGLSQVESVLKTDEAVAYVIQVIDQVIESGAKIAKVPLIRHFLEKTPSKSTNKLEDGNIFVTEIVGRIVNQHLTSKISIVGTQFAEANIAVAEELDELLVHHDDPKSMKWGDESYVIGYYDSVELDGVVYREGDIVAVAPGDDDHRHRANYEESGDIVCLNTFANNAWFARIQYFFERSIHGKRTKMFHGHWLVHGSRTLLQEVAHSQELFLLPECDDNPVASLLQKCNVRILEVDEFEEPDEQNPSSRDYFLRSTYDQNFHSFSDLPTPAELERLLQHVPDHRQCPNCAHKNKMESDAIVRVVGDGLSRYGQVLHKNDFVYVLPEAVNTAQELLFIARIKSVDTEGRLLSVRYYDRASSDSRCLRQSPRQNAVSVENLDLDCRPFVESFWSDTDGAIRDWIADDENHFYVVLDEDEDAIRQCDECFHGHCTAIDDGKRQVRKRGKIPVMEVFAGAGGLSQGFCQSGFFTTDWALEWSYSAAKTFSINHPETTVMCADINEFLKYVVRRAEDGQFEPLRALDPEKSIIPDECIPHPGAARVLCGGPPCQSFSRMNTHKKDNDPRSSLPFTMLSIAEVYKPEFFLLENVTGLLDHAEKYTVHGAPIKMAMLKLLSRILLALNYQVLPVLSQAGQHGCVQNRPRFFLFGARRGSVLPKAPLPMYVFKPAQRRKLFIQGDYLYPAKRGRKGNPEDDEDGHNFAPHAGVTIKHATSDLPQFDWINPHELIAETETDIETVERRKARGIKQFDTSTAPVGFVDPVAYLSEPKTRYQRNMRRMNYPLVKDHVTNRYSAFNVEATVTVPLQPFATHKRLPKIFNIDPKKSARFGRLDNDGPFKTALTTVTPSSHGSYLLHPKQKRTISVLEAKRAQGFPDHFELWSDSPSAAGKIRQYYKHLGNAVPVPLAAAVGRSFERAFLESHPGREESPEAEDEA